MKWFRTREGKVVSTTRELRNRPNNELGGRKKKPKHKRKTDLRGNSGSLRER